MSAIGRYWILTIPKDDFTQWTELRDNVIFLTGQLESGGQTGYQHWQLMAIFNRNTRLAGVKKTFGTRIHAELTRSAAAEGYCNKEDTAIDGTRFTIGEKPFKRNSKVDWEQQLAHAKHGELEKCDPSIQLRYYGTLKKLGCDYRKEPDDLCGVCGVWIFGPAGVGKSRFVRENYGGSLFSKMINKWWDGYKDEKFVLLDDFDKSHEKLGHHVKIWSDRYKFMAEQKGTSLCIRPDKIIVTSNYRIDEIFHDDALIKAIQRRFYMIEMLNKPSCF